MRKYCAGCRTEQEFDVPIELFFFQDMEIELHDPHGFCPTCAGLNFSRLFAMHGNLLRYANRKIAAIDWKDFRKKYESASAASLVEFLLYSRILSLDPVGNWLVMSDSKISLNPIFVCRDTYFTSFEAAAGYCKESISGTAYSWTVMQIGECFSKHEVLNRKIPPLLQH